LRYPAADRPVERSSRLLSADDGWKARIPLRSPAIPALRRFLRSTHPERDDRANRKCRSESAYRTARVRARTPATVVERVHRSTADKPPQDGGRDTLRARRFLM